MRDDDNALVTQVVLFPAESAPKVGAAVWVTVGIVAGVVATKAAPHVKNRFNDLRSKLSRKSEDSVEAAAQGARPEQCDSELTARRVLTGHPTGSRSALRSGARAKSRLTTGPA